MKPATAGTKAKGQVGLNQLVQADAGGEKDKDGMFLFCLVDQSLSPYFTVDTSFTSGTCPPVTNLTGWNTYSLYCLTGHWTGDAPL